MTAARHILDGLTEAGLLPEILRELRHRGIIPGATDPRPGEGGKAVSKKIKAGSPQHCGNGSKNGAVMVGQEIIEMGKQAGWIKTNLYHYEKKNGKRKRVYEYMPVYEMRYCGGPWVKPAVDIPVPSRPYHVVIKTDPEDDPEDFRVEVPGCDDVVFSESGTSARAEPRKKPK